MLFPFGRLVIRSTVTISLCPASVIYEVLAPAILHFLPNWCKKPGAMINRAFS